MEFNIVMSVQSCTAWMFFTFIQSNNKVPERSKDGQESVPILPQRPDFASEVLIQGIAFKCPEIMHWMQWDH